MADEVKQEPKPGEKRITDIQAVSQPTAGTMTFAAEGIEGSKYASRYPHVPSDASGVTLGRGYDMKTKSITQIKTDLMAAGLTEEDAKKFELAAGLSGAAAKKFITDNNLEDFSITPLQQASLFDASYTFESDEVKRLCTKKDVEATYGKCDWDKLNSFIKEMLIDMKFRGDYTPEARKLLQKHVSDNNLEEFKKVMIDEKNWTNVPKDRFDRRVEYLKNAK
jgi:hypothetical protein